MYFRKFGERSEGGCENLFSWALVSFQENVVSSFASLYVNIQGALLPKAMLLCHVLPFMKMALITEMNLTGKNS